MDLPSRSRSLHVVTEEHDLHQINLSNIAALALDRTRAGRLAWRPTGSGGRRWVGAITMLTITKAGGDGFEFVLQQADDETVWASIVSWEHVFHELWAAACGDGEPLPAA